MLRGPKLLFPPTRKNHFTPLTSGWSHLAPHERLKLPRIIRGCTGVGAKPGSRLSRNREGGVLASPLGRILPTLP